MGSGVHWHRSTGIFAIVGGSFNSIAGHTMLAVFLIQEQRGGI